jgi:hypothetical protein
MRFSQLVVIAAGVGLVLSITASMVAAPASAATDLSGTWSSDSLRDNDIGYHFDLTAVPNTSAGYIGTFQFSFRDGRKGSKVPVRVTATGNKVTFIARSGSFDKSGTVLRGVLTTKGPSIRMTNCQARLNLVMARDLASDCTFRPAKAS